MIKDERVSKSMAIKVAAIIICITIIYSLLTFNGLIDYFAPKHITQIEETIRSSYLSTERMVNQIPGFYAFGAMVKLITNISNIGFLIYPLQIIPYLILFYTFIYKVSSSYMLASIIAFIHFTAGTTGTSQFFFWPHGIGNILYFTALLVFVLMMFKNNQNAEYKLLFILTGLSIVFISYNMYSFIILFLIIFTIVIGINSAKFLKIKNNISNYKKELTTLVVILLVAQLGLSQFVYQSFIPTIMSNVEVTGLEKFIVAYFNKEPASDQLLISGLLITYPPTIALISIVKYTIIIASITVFLWMLIQKYRTNKELNFLDQLTFSFIIVHFIYGLIRLSIGQIPITQLYFPGILCIIWLHRHPNWKKLATLSLLIILVLNPIYTFSMNEAAPKDNIHNTEFIKQSSNWYFQHKNNSISPVSDELTRNLFQFYIYDSTTHFDTTSIIKSEQIAFLLQKPSIQQNQKNYYILNYQSHSMSIQNWRIIKSWKYSEDIINSNKELNRIYNVGELSIYI